jgi:hypothetical protein
MKLLTEDAVLRCPHGARVDVPPTQTLVRVNGRRLLVNDDPENKTIRMCPNFTLSGIKPCNHSLRVEQGYSLLSKIDGRAVCLDSVTGLTDGTPPATHKYIVISPGQELVGSMA